MPYATTHILIAIILIELFREYFVKDNSRFPRYYILIAAIGAVLPDLDVMAYYVLYFFGFTFEQVHRTFLHTIFVPLILFLIGIIIWKLKIRNPRLAKRHIKLPIVFYILGFGALLHLILDAILSGQIMFFYPFSKFAIGLNLVNIFPVGLRELVLPTLDGILLLFWIFWMEFKLKISDYF